MKFNNQNLKKRNEKSQKIRLFFKKQNILKWYNGFYIEFRQNFAKETFSYDEHLKS